MQINPNIEKYRRQEWSLIFLLWIQFLDCFVPLMRSRFVMSCSTDPSTWANGRSSGCLWCSVSPNEQKWMWGISSVCLCYFLKSNLDFYFTKTLLLWSRRCERAPQTDKSDLRLIAVSKVTSDNFTLHRWRLSFINSGWADWTDSDQLFGTRKHRVWAQVFYLRGRGWEEDLIKEKDWTDLPPPPKNKTKQKISTATVKEKKMKEHPVSRLQFLIKNLKNQHR